MPTRRCTGRGRARDVINVGGAKRRTRARTRETISESDSNWVFAVDLIIKPNKHGYKTLCGKPFVPFVVTRMVSNARARARHTITRNRHDLVSDDDDMATTTTITTIVFRQTGSAGAEKTRARRRDPVDARPRRLSCRCDTSAACINSRTRPVRSHSLPVVPPFSFPRNPDRPTRQCT